MKFRSKLPHFWLESPEHGVIQLLLSIDASTGPYNPYVFPQKHILPFWNATHVVSGQYPPDNIPPDITTRQGYGLG